LATVPPPVEVSRPGDPTRPLDLAEEAVRSRLARHPFFDKLFLLHRNWMLRITMLMVVATFIWAIVGGADALNVRIQDFAWATTGSLPLSNESYYAAITLHAIRMLFGFVQQLTMAFFGYLVVLEYRVKARAKWLLYGAVGVFNLGVGLTNGPIYLFPQFNDSYFAATGWYFLSPIGLPGYSSYDVSPLWFWAWILMAIGTFAWSAWMIVHIRDGWRARAGRPWSERVPVWLAVIIMDAVFFVVTYIGVLASSTEDLWYLAHPQSFNVLTNQVLFWEFGHSIVYALFFVGIAVLYWLIPILVDRPLYSWRMGMVAVLLYFLLSALLGIHHLYLTPLPVLDSFLTMVGSYGIIVPSAITFFTLWMTTKGVTRFRWNTVSLFIASAWAGGIGAGLSGGALATVSFDVVVHNTLFVVSHFHAMLLLFILPAAFAGAYVTLPLLTGRRWISRRLGTIHFVLTTVGMAGFVFSLEELGLLGLLRRAEIFPRVPAIVLGEELATVFALVIGAGQIAFLANLILTVFRGPLWVPKGSTLQDAVQDLWGSPPGADPTPRRSEVPAPSGPAARPRATLARRKERWEHLWVGTVVAALIVTLAFSSPASLGILDNTHGASDAPTEWVNMQAHQYYWSTQESGPLNGSYNDLVVVYAGQSVEINLTSPSVTQGLYLPFRTQNVVNVQVVPGYQAYASFVAPTSPGIYPMPESEYDGPWFGLDMADLLVLPAGGSWTPSAVNDYAVNAADWDLYASPVWLLSSSSVSLTADAAGLWAGSIPGPTIVAPSGGFTLQYSIPLNTIGPLNYLVNTTSESSTPEQQWVTAHGDHLPATMGIWNVTSTGWVPLITAPLTVGSMQTLSTTLAPGTYFYGMDQPLSYTYDPYGESGPSTGYDSGEMLALWGVLIVPSGGT
jgi:heme/copper-type cytochrome/quinol oxidase subunit 1